MKPYFEEFVIESFPAILGFIQHIIWSWIEGPTQHPKTSNKERIGFALVLIGYIILYTFSLVVGLRSLVLVVLVLGATFPHGKAGVTLTRTGH